MDKPTIILQARLTSKRFPNKVLANLWEVPLIKHVLENLSNTGFPIIVAIPFNPQNDPLVYWLDQNKYKWFRGLEHDVLDRFYQCAKKNNLKDIIRVCADTPLIRASDIIKNYVQFLEEERKRMVYGNGSWVFNFKMLEQAWKYQRDAETREHVIRSMQNSVDYPEDIERIERIMKWKE